MRKKITFLLFVGMALLAILPANAQTWPPIGMRGDGNSEEAAWEIGSNDDLAALAAYVNAGNSALTDGKHYKLMNNLDLKGWDNGDGKGWKPIGDYTGSNSAERLSRTFQGTFDGNGYLIKNMTINRLDEDYIGLFGYLYYGNIKDIGIVDCNVTGNGRVGGLVGENRSSTITHSYATGSVNGTGYVGGLVGNNNQSSTIIHSYATGSVNGTYWVGGLVGRNEQSSITHSYATGSVTGSSDVGGLVGVNHYSSLITHSYATGSVNGNDFVGGLVGMNSLSTIQNCVAANDSVTAAETTDLINRIAGRSSGGTYSNNYALRSMEVTANNQTVTITPNQNRPSGGDQSLTDLQSYSFYSTGGNWYNGIAWSITPSSETQEGIWKICDGEGFPFLSWQQDIICSGLQSHTITAIAGANGSIAPEGEIQVTAGDNKTFTFIADNGYEVHQLLIDGVHVPDSIAGGSYTFENVTENHTIAVIFKVIAVGEQILFTWNADANSEKSFELRATAGKAFVVDWGDGTTNTYIGNGYNNISLSHTYASTAAYFVSVSASTTDGHFIYLNCSNNQLTALDVRQNSALTVLHCNNNQLTALDVRQNSALTHLSCSNNQLSTLNLSGATALSTLLCYNNQLTALDLSQNSALITLYCDNNQLTALDVNGATALSTLWCFGNKLTALGVSTNTALSVLRCYNNKLTALDLSQNSALEYLQCFNNQLTALDVSQNSALTYLYCFSNQLTALDVNGATALSTLLCYNNQLTALDLSQNSALTELSCSNNQLTVLDLSQNSALTELSCSNNQLTVLDLSQNSALIDFRCYNNLLTFSALPLPPYPNYQYTPQAKINGGIAPGFVDLSSEYSIDTVITVYRWYEVTDMRESLISPDRYTDHGNGTFTFGDSFNEKTLRCKMTNATFPNFTASAPLVYEVTMDIPTRTITATAGENGMITPYGGVTVYYGEDQTFTFTPSACYQIDQVLINGVNNTEAVANGTYTFTNVTDDQTIAVSFKLISYTITATAGEGGTITPSGAVSVDCGSNKTFTFTPSACYQIDQVLINGVNNAEAVANGTYTFTNVTDGQTIAVSFKLISYTITATAGEGGTIMPSGAVSVDCGSNKTFTFTPSACCQIDQVLINGVNNAEAVANGTYTFTNVTDDQTIAVSFKLISYTITATAGEGGTIMPSGAVSVDCGSNKTFTFTPSACYQIDQVLINGVNNTEAVANGTYTFTNVTDDQTIAVSFKLISYTITATAGEGGTIMPSGTVSVDCGSDKTFTFTPSACYQIDQVLINGVNNAEAVANGTYTFTNVTDDQTIAVSFKLISYTITATAGEGGTIMPSGAVSVDCGSNKTFTFTPSACYQIDQVLINGVNNAEAVANGTYTFTNVTDDQTIAVSFKLISYTITATAGEGGTITPSGAVSVDCGSNKTLTFTPSACYQIDQVLINGVNNAEAVANGTYTFTNVTDDQTIAVSFKLISYTITATAGEGGTIMPSGAVSVDCGSNKTFTFTPSACYQIDQVLINGVNNAEAVANGTYTFTNVTDDQTIAVSFKLISYTITATAGEGGTIMPSGAVSVDCGSNKTFTFTPSACYQIDQVLINGVNNAEAVANGTYTFTNVTDDQAIAVSFKLISYTITATAGEGGTIMPSGAVSVDCGSNKTFTFTPSACCQIDQVLINGVNNAEAVANGTYTFTNVTDDQAIAVSFKLISYTITATAGEGGTIMPSGAVSVDCGSNKTFTFTPSACYQIDQVLINGVNNAEAVANGTYTFTNVTDDQTIAVSFKLISYTITATAGEGGTITPSGAVSVDCGSNKTFTFTPLACYQIDQVLINGVNNTEAVANGTYTFTNVTDDQTIAVSFKLISYTITATAGEGGTITPSGAVSVDCGSNKTFTFTPSACYQIDQVLINGVNNAEAVANATYTFTNVTDDQTIAVSFKLISYTITATAGEGGTITPSGAVSVDCGSDKTFTFSPSACYQIDQVLINGVNNAEAVANGTYTFTNVTDDQTIAVSFKLISYTITATAGEGGTIMPSGAVSVDCGSNKTFTFTPSACYQIDQVLINGVNNAEAVANGTYTFTNVTDDQTIAVSFKLISYTITATAGEGGTITPSGAVSVDCGSNKTFTFTPSACYQIDQVLINGVNNTEAVANGTYTFTNVTDDQTIAVSFKLISYTITATAGEGGTITPSGAVSVDCGSNKTFTFTPSACYQIDQVLINGVNNAEAVANGTYAFTNVTDDQTIAVSFKAVQVSNIELLGCPENGWLVDGETLQLQAVVLPDNALNNSLTWRSTNPYAAIVDATGKVTARSTGVTYIIAKAQEGGVADTCYIRVVQPVTGIVLTPAQATLLLGEEKQLMANILPENATIRDIIWSSSDETAVTVDDHGKITGIAAGEGVITVKTVDGDFEATCRVTVLDAHVPATGVTVTPTTLAIGRGETYQLSAEVKPADASQMVTWSSSNLSVATVEADGTVTALAAGKATITAKTDNNYKATCSVTVTIPIDSIVVTPDEWTLPLKGVKALKATVYPADASNKTIKWSSANTALATVSATGVVTAKNINGVVEIYATNTASGISGICAITVGTGIPAAPPMDISEGNTTNYIVLYPNPTSGKITIKSTSLLGRPVGAIKVFDITGRLVLEMNHVDDNEVILDLSGYAAGVYFINVDGKTMKVVKK